MSATILLGPTSKHFQNSKALRAGSNRVGEVSVDRFPGGESYCQIQENIRGEDVFIVQSVCAPANESLMDLLVMGDTARRASAGRLTAVIPYFGYMRQDRKDKPRVPITAKLVMNLLSSAGFNRVITVDVHTLQAQGFTDMPFDHLFGFPILAEYLEKNTDFSNTVFVAPDLGAVKRAKAYAKVFKTRFAVVDKERISPSQIETGEVIGDVEGKHCILVDDLTESCSTLIGGAVACRGKGAISVDAAVTHCCLHKQGRVNLDKAFNEGTISRFITTNTTNAMPVMEGDKLFVLDASRLIGEAIRRTHNNESITDLFGLNGY